MFLGEPNKCGHISKWLSLKLQMVLQLAVPFLRQLLLLISKQIPDILYQIMPTRMNFQESPSSE
eukprot:1153022-Pelagomonas_calceolata.AAC.6